MNCPGDLSSNGLYLEDFDGTCVENTWKQNIRTGSGPGMHTVGFSMEDMQKHPPLAVLFDA
jgi:hypothetical protein